MEIKSTNEKNYFIDLFAVWGLSLGLEQAGLLLFM